MKWNIVTCILKSPGKIFQLIGSSIWLLALFKVGAICQGILGRVRDGTASSKHAEDRGMKVYPLSEFAWSIVKDHFK